MERGFLNGINASPAARFRAMPGIAAISFALLILAGPALAGDRTLFGPKRYDLKKGKPAVYTDRFAGCQNSRHAVLRVTNGESRDTRVTSGRIEINGFKAATERDFKRMDPSFEKPIAIRQDNQLKVLLKGGHRGCDHWAREYRKSRLHDLAEELAILTSLRQGMLRSGASLESGEMNRLLRKVRELGQSCADREARLVKLQRLLDEPSAAEGEDDEVEPEGDESLDSRWIREHRDSLQWESREAAGACEDCRRLLEAHDRAKPSRRNDEYERKKAALHSLCDALKELALDLGRAARGWAEIEAKIERWQRDPAFVVVEIVGRDCDSLAPVLSGPQPADGATVETARPVVTVQYTDGDAGAGIDTARVTMVLDGKDVTASATVTDTSVSHVPSEPLADGLHGVTVTVFDRAGNQAGLTWRFIVRTVVTVVKITSPQNGQFVNTPVITVAGSITNPAAFVTVDGVPAQVSGESFSLPGVDLAEGPNTLAVEAKDAAGNASSDSIVVHLDTVAPDVAVISPLPDSYTNIASVTVTGNVNEPVTSVTVNGKAVVVSGIEFSFSGLSLVDGVNRVAVEALDRAGNAGTAVVTIHLDRDVPVIKITSPLENARLNTPAVTVAGTVGEPVASLKINGMPVQMAGLEFSLADVALLEGPNVITVEAIDSAGNIATAAIAVTLDTLAPVVQIDSPRNESYLNTATIAVTGTLGEPVTSVIVNGISASFTDRGFILGSLTLTEGTNTLAVEARDEAGNIGTATAMVHLDTQLPVVTITAPQANAFLNTPTVAVSGSIDEPVVSAIVNGIVANVTETGFRLDSLILAEGLNTITVEVLDRAGNVAAAGIAVNLDTQPPVIAIATPQADAFLREAVIPVNGTLNEAVAAVTVNGFPADITAGGFSLDSLTLADGTNAVVVEARDPAGNIGTVALTVHLDRELPVIQFAAPEPVVYVNAPLYTVAGQVNEPVAAVTVNGAAAQMTGMDFSLAGVNLAEGANTITVATQDAAGNAGTATLTVLLDRVPPVLGISTPAPNSSVNTTAITVSGTLSEAECTVTVNGVPAKVEGTNFQLPGLALSEGINTITVSAADRAGNTESRTVGVTLDTSLPAVTLSTPAEAAAGANVAIVVSAGDNLGLALCELAVNGAPIWSYVANGQPSAVNAFVYSLPPDLSPGTQLDVTAQVRDVAGNMNGASARITVNSGPSGPGYLQGEVYDDTRGLRLEGAMAAIYAADGQLLTSLTTPADGQYLYPAQAGDYLVVLGKEGFTAVERRIAVRPEKNAVAMDARLTPIGMGPNLIGAGGGRIAAGAGLDLLIPAGALGQTADIRVTPIGNQGLAGILPMGWSPVAVADIRFSGTAATFLQAASLKITLSGVVSLAPASTVPLARYDAAGHRWVAQGTATVSADGAFVATPIALPGQYCLVLPDHGLVPPALIDGQPLPSLAESTATDDMTAEGKVVPPAAPPAAGLRVVGEVVALSGTKTLHSGLVVNGRVTERFNLLSGETAAPPEYIQDLILYQYPCATNMAPASTGSTLNADLDAFNTGKVGTSFPVMPSRECTILDLLAGKVSIEITLPAAEAKGTMVGADGARVTDGDGNVLVIPQNALVQRVPVEMKTIEPSLVAGIVGADFSLLRAIGINLANRTLAQTAEIAIPVPAGLDPALPVIVAKLIDVRGAGMLKLIALAQASGSLITSVPVPAGGTGGSPLAPGIIASGTYLFLQARAPLGFVTGLVADAGGNPYPSALVASNTCTLVDLTGQAGTYLIASTVSPFTARATDVYKYDEGEGQGTVASAYGTTTVNLTIRPVPPRVETVVFTDSGRGIEPNTSVTVTFNEALDKSTVTGDTIMVKDASGNRLAGSFSTSPEGSVVTFYPANMLVSQATYTLTISGNVKDLQGYVMGQDDVRSFTIRNTTPPPMPPAGSIGGTFPDADGYVTVTATQGSADPGNMVLIMNDTTGEVLSVTPAANGSFTGRIFAMLGDEIRVLLMDNAGNKTLISTIAMKDAEGRHLVTTKGGIVEGEGGTRLEIPDGALMGPTIVKIAPVAEAALPHPVPSGAGFLAAVNIDAGGTRFLKPLKLSVPAPANMAQIPAGSMPFVSQPAELTNADGTKEQVYVVADSAKVIDGRLTTASPPFAGVSSDGNWVFEYPHFDIAIISGYTYREMNGTAGYQPDADLPVKRAVIRTPGAWNHVSYSNENGGYAAFAEVASNVPGYPCRGWGLTAINPLTLYRVNSNVQICDWPNNLVKNFNIRLADKDTMPPDRAAPEISLNLTVVPGQVIPGLGTAPQFVAGAIPAGTDLDVPITIVDRDMASATLSIKFTSLDGLSNQSHEAQLNQAVSEIQNYVSADVPVAIYRYAYLPGFPEAIAGSQAKYFRPGAPGTYTLTLEARDSAGNKNSQSLEVRVILPGEAPSGINGAPRVDEILPRDRSTNVMVSATISVTFSEPVDTATLTANSFQLIDVTKGSPVPAFIYASLEGGRMKATLLPQSNLAYSREYEIFVSREIRDSVLNDPPFEAYMPLDREYRARFTTKAPTLYDLDSGFALTPGGKGGTDISLYTHRESGRSYAYIALEEAGWGVVDVTDPVNPVMTHQVNYTQPPQSTTPTVSWRYRGAAVEPEQGVLALTEWVTWNCEGCGNFGYIGFYDIQSHPEQPLLVGRDRLSEGFSGVPYHVVLSGDYAYVSTIMVGIQVVDRQKAATAHEPGESNVGYYDSLGEGYGSPYDIAMLKGNLYVPTATGHLLILSTAAPQLPTLIGKVDPGDAFRAWRISVIGDYAFTDAAGRQQIMDVAVASSGFGDIYIVNVTDPRNPKVISSLGGISGTDISISKTGLVYITAGTTVDVVDIKNPYSPILLNAISQAPTGGGSTIALGYSQSLAEQDGWVYLANQEQGMRVLNLDPFSVQIVNLGGVGIQEVRYASDGSDGNKAFFVKVTTDGDAARSCPKLKGTISVRTGYGLSEQKVQAPEGIGYESIYNLVFEKETDTTCAAKIKDEPQKQSRFILSNHRIADPAGTVPIYGSIEAGKIVVEVEQDSGGTVLAAEDNKKKRAEATKEPIQVIVLAIDGLRQDVLYDSNEQMVYPGASSPYHVEINSTNLPGLSQILKADSTVKLKDVTAIFPSVTLASWASVFTGKMPNETGILGNEFFARDSDLKVPSLFNKTNPGMITFDGGAFKGFDAYGAKGIFSPDFFVPRQSPWNATVNPEGTPQNDLLKPQTVFSMVSDLPKVKAYFESKGGDPVVAAYTHYARGARWLTWDLVIPSWSSAKLLDRASWWRFREYLNGRYLSEGKRNRVPFSALTVWYLPGLDHEAHFQGMSAYIPYFMETTDSYIEDFVDWLKYYGEFDNKIFIVVADHGHTEMPSSEQMIIEEKDENGNVIQTWNGDTSCKQKIEKFKNKRIGFPELANNNLHILELANALKHIGKNNDDNSWWFTVRAPSDIAILFKLKNIMTGTIGSLSYGANECDSDVIVGLNGPMVHIYLKDIGRAGKFAEIIRITFQGDYPDEALQWWGMEALDYAGFKETEIDRLRSSVDKIIIRLSGKYVVFDGLNSDMSIRKLAYDSLETADYVDAWNRINGMNDENRSGDIVLIMRDKTSGDVNERYTAGVACKAWHGSLNPSDSFTPYILSFTGGNKNEIEKILMRDEVCKMNYSRCKGNWMLAEVVKAIILGQYK